MAYVLLVTIAPLAALVHFTSKSYEAARVWNGLCIDVAGTDPDARAKCWTEFAAHDGPQAWPILSEAFVAFAIIGAIAWLILFGATKVIRWILAGRENNHKM